MSNNMYRVGDYVYFDVVQASPYSIRRIEELIKNTNGNVEAKVLCFFRRRDISNSLISLADKHNIALEEEQELEAESLSEKQKHQLKHRELFFSRQIETLPATHIRGKCNVTLLNETESLSSYLDKEDSFFYTLVYEPNQKTLLADRGEIRVGSRYQAEVQQKRPEPSEVELNRKCETLVFRPNHLTEAEIEQYLTIVKSIGTFGRALDHSSSVKQPNLLITAATASRDVTIQKAMDVLHQNDYDIGKALLSFTPNNVPLICKDELDEWSPAEASLFEESIDKYGKTFLEIRKDVLPWKKMKNIVEYYYMWKTTDRYVPQKRHKANENESKLKQVYIPNTSGKQQVNGGSGTIPGDVPGKSCESCAKTSSALWYVYGAAHTNNRLCQDCWTYFKKFGGLRYPSKYFVQEEAAAAATAAASAADKQSPESAVTNNNSNAVSGNGQASENSNSVASSNNSSSSTTPATATATGKESPQPTSDGAEAELKCKECSKTFNRQESLVSHMATHHQYKCTYCNKEYRIKTHLARHIQQSHSANGRSDSPRQIMKTRPAFLVRPHQQERAARVLLPELVRLQSLSKNPFLTINVTQIKQEMQTKYPKLPESPSLKPAKRGKVVEVAYRLGIEQQTCPDWLIALPKDKLPQPERLAFPLGEQSKVSTNSNGLYLTAPSRKRTHEQSESDSNSCSQSLNRRARAPEQLTIRMNGSTTNGKSRVSIVRTGGKSKLIGCEDAPEDILFIRTEATRKLRQQAQGAIVKRLRRMPCSREPELPPVYDASKLV